MSEPEDRIGMLIRSEHPHAFRCGQWGWIVGITEVQKPGYRTATPCYVIRWDTRSDKLARQDWWPVEDPVADYQFAVLYP